MSEKVKPGYKQTEVGQRRLIALPSGFLRTVPRGSALAFG